MRKLKKAISALRYLKARYKDEYTKGLLKFYGNYSNLFDAIDDISKKSDIRTTTSRIYRMFKKLLIEYATEPYCLLKDKYERKYTKDYVSYKDLTPEVVEEIADWCLREKCFRRSSTKMYLAFLKCIFKHLISLNRIQHSESPFSKTTYKIIKRARPDSTPNHKHVHFVTSIII